ncbi:peptidyl-prolyl cis-trans isomerase CYP37, chloroplastic isoform X2 [Macadamia integrifolia]|uniref:peptidyl-prolyl cis-trans isomerase CYP37, chloroplastic isoform X2 n=1 Tax=Macadamia integrifolia TaxID=60698 RepID=UPI001C5304B0|nr:peptidyl-prolyl cis-trans isomerase CYP37, chloroplastic isoform X2 [Macadamia integrifolia]
MASLLSSAIFPHNHCLRRQAFPSIHPLFLLNHTIARKEEVATAARVKIRCLSAKNPSKESPNLHDFSTVPYMSTLLHKMKNIPSAIAVILMFVQFSSPVPSKDWNPWLISAAEAVLYSPDTKVPRTGELALRKAIPANSNMKAMQESLEEISFLLRIPQRKPFGTMEGNVKRALKIATDEKESILGSIPTDLKEKGSVLYASLIDGKGGLLNLLESIKDKDPDRVSVGLASSLDTVADLELLQVVIDGYSAPLTAGNFAKLVVDGAYDGVKLNCVNQAVLSDNGVEKNKGYDIPLEIMPSGQFEPLYRTTLSVQDGELPVLPLSVYGAVAMAHSEVSEDSSSPYQFFFYLYDKRNAGLGGLSFDEGQFSVFGYTTLGRDILSQINTGDVIRSARLVEGRDRLILPDES